MRRIQLLLGILGFFWSYSAYAQLSDEIRWELSRNKGIWEDKVAQFACDFPTKKNCDPNGDRKAKDKAGDSVLFNSVLCYSEYLRKGSAFTGNEPACKAVEDSQVHGHGDLDGQWRRSPLSVAAAPSILNGSGRPFSKDHTLGVLLYLVVLNEVNSSKARSLATKWLNYMRREGAFDNHIKKLVEEVPQNILTEISHVPEYLVDGTYTKNFEEYVRVPASDTGKLVCVLSGVWGCVAYNWLQSEDNQERLEKALLTYLYIPGLKVCDHYDCIPLPPLYALMHRVWNHLGLNPHPAMIYYGGEFGPPAISWGSVITDMIEVANYSPKSKDYGNQLHLKAVTALLRRHMGITTPSLIRDSYKGETYDNDDLIAEIYSRQKRNTFYYWLAGSDSNGNAGASANGVALDIIEKCQSVVADNYIEENKGDEWSWERNQSSRPWEDSMGWDCILIANLLKVDSSEYTEQAAIVHAELEILKNRTNQLSSEISSFIVGMNSDLSSPYHTIVDWLIEIKADATEYQDTNFLEIPSGWITQQNQFLDNLNAQFDEFQVYYASYQENRLAEGVVNAKGMEHLAVTQAVASSIQILPIKNQILENQSQIADLIDHDLSKFYGPQENISTIISQMSLYIDDYFANVLLLRDMEPHFKIAQEQAIQVLKDHFEQSPFNEYDAVNTLSQVVSDVIVRNAVDEMVVAMKTDPSTFRLIFNDTTFNNALTKVADDTNELVSLAFTAYLNGTLTEAENEANALVNNYMASLIQEPLKNLAKIAADEKLQELLIEAEGKSYNNSVALIQQEKASIIDQTIAEFENTVEENRSGYPCLLGEQKSFGSLNACQFEDHVFQQNQSTLATKSLWFENAAISWVSLNYQELSDVSTVENTLPQDGIQYYAINIPNDQVTLSLSATASDSLKILISQGKIPTLESHDLNCGQGTSVSCSFSTTGFSATLTWYVAVIQETAPIENVNAYTLNVYSDYQIASTPKLFLESDVSGNFSTRYHVFENTSHMNHLWVSLSSSDPNVSVLLRKGKLPNLAESDCEGRHFCEAESSEDGNWYMQVNTTTSSSTDIHRLMNPELLVPILF